MSELGAINLWRLRYTIEFGNIQRYDLGNGNLGRKFVPEFKRKAASYRISQRMLISNPGLDLEKDKVFAVRHKKNMEYSTFKARWNGKLYNITDIIPDDSKILTYDLITLRSSDKNG